MKDYKIGLVDFFTSDYEEVMERGFDYIEVKAPTFHDLGVYDVTLKTDWFDKIEYGLSSSYYGLSDNIEMIIGEKYKNIFIITITKHYQYKSVNIHTFKKAE